MSVDLDASADAAALGEALGDAISQLPEYEALREAEQAVKDSDEAQEYIERFEQSREQFMLARRIGEATQEDAQSLRAIQEELHELPVMQRYLAAQTELDQRLARINDAISDGLDIDFASAAGSCCHD